MTKYTLTTIDTDTIVAHTPFDPAFNKAAKGLNGRWNKEHKGWVFNVAYKEPLENLLRLHFADSGVSTSTTRPRSNHHLGKIGSKLTIQLDVEFVKDMVNRYGDRETIVRFYVLRDQTTGAQVVWRSSSKTDRFHVGERITLTGIVKDHGEYRGELQTQMTRCKGALVRGVLPAVEPSGLPVVPLDIPTEDPMIDSKFLELTEDSGEFEKVDLHADFTPIAF